MLDFLEAKKFYLQAKELKDSGHVTHLDVAEIERTLKTIAEDGVSGLDLMPDRGFWQDLVSTNDREAKVPTV
jgi:hypothetical protein